MKCNFFDGKITDVAQYGAGVGTHEILKRKRQLQSTEVFSLK